MEGKGNLPEKGPLDTKAIVNVVNAVEDDGAREIEVIRLKFGNTGLELIFSDRRLMSPSGQPPWMMHFRPEFSTKPKTESRFQYSRMFAAGFISMIITLTSGEVNVYPELFKALNTHPPEKVGFNTNDTMWNFARSLVGEKYFTRIPQDFSKIRPELHQPIIRLLDEKGWPGDFLLTTFLADYSSDPSILKRSTDLAASEKLENLKVKK